MTILYLSKRFALMVLTVLSATLITFMLLRLSPGDPAELIVQKVFVGSEDYSSSAEEIKAVEDHLQLNSPLISQYGQWLVNVALLDFGVSYTTGQNVNHELKLHIWPTFSLAGLSLALSLLLTVMVSALYNLCTHPLIRKIGDGASVMSIAVPNFYLGILFILVFSIYFDALPVSGFGGARHYILPVVTLALTMFGYTTTILNDSVSDIRNQSYMITARAKGLSAFTIFRDHILRNAVAPVIPYIALQLGYLLGGVMVIETLFSWPGIGKYLVDAIATKDIPVIQACIAVIACGFSVANLLADLMIWLVDPRVRF